MGLTGGGAQSEQAIAHERQLMPVPASLTWEEAGGLSEVFLTAAQALFVQAEVGPGDRVLITGAAGGVGTAAVQIARAAGAAVTGSVRTAESRAAVAGFGAEALDPAEALERGPFDVIIDTVGGEGIADEVKALARGGRLVVIGVGAGAKVVLNMLHLMYRGARLSATTLRAMPLEERATLARLAERRVLPLIKNGTMRVQIARTFTFDEVADAYEWFTRPGKVGKVVLFP
jgi:NADPH:quinone reductase-like Zn-dependent oxidoreductase